MKLREVTEVARPENNLVQTFADFKIGTACVRLRVQTFESPSNFKIRPRLSCPNSPIPESADLEIHFRDTPPKWIFDPADNPKPYKNSNLQPAVQPAL